MIKIKKSENIPEILQVQGNSKKKKLCEAYTFYLSEYSTPFDKDKNPFKFNFDNETYGHITVKDQIKYDQRNKCCYCENKDFDDLAYGDVEHYRPKAAYANNETDKILRVPGYYWLAYDWDNLLFSCQICNQRYKKNFFPLLAGEHRTSNHNESLESVTGTLLINPYIEDPEPHIGFRKEVIFPITDKGENSIKYYGLDRDLLDPKRKRHLEEVRRNILLSKIKVSSLSQEIVKEVMEDLGATDVDNLQEIIDSAIDYIYKAAKVDAAFALMVRCNFNRLPRN